MVKAKKLEEMLMAFRLEPLKENELADFYHDKTMTIRTGDQWTSPLDELFEACTVPSASNAHLLMGHTGCGKSTELNNLKVKFRENGHPVCMVDTLIETNPFQLGYWDILLLITEGLIKIADDIGADIPEAAVDGISDILLREIKVEETSFSSVGADINAGAEAKTPSIVSGLLKLFVSLKGSLKLGTDIRTTVKETMQKRASEWLMYTKEISARITAAAGEKQPILIFENLDKIPQPETIFDILGFSVLAQMPFPVIYTFPIDQYYAPRIGTLGVYNKHLLPMIKVSNLDKTESTEGITVMREIVGLRAELELFDEAVLDLLIKKTGGSLRHLFACIISAARRATRRSEVHPEVVKIEEEDALRALAELSKELTRQITRPKYGILIDIINNPESKENIDDLDFLLKMMQASVVLEYENGTRWNDVHPLIADFLAKHAPGENHG